MSRPAGRIPTHRAPTHPGEILVEEFLRPRGITVAEAASRLGIPGDLRDLVEGRCAVTGAMAERLERLFGLKADTWLNLQRAWDQYQGER